MSSIPEYCTPGARLPKGGPDRIRFCFWYADALDKGLEHAAAIEDARQLLRLFYWYAAFGGADLLGSHAGAVPVALRGEVFPSTNEESPGTKPGA